jgi:hypothetical protein
MRDPRLPEDAVRAAVDADRDADWLDYVAACVEMERMDAGEFFGTSVDGGPDDRLWGQNRYYYPARSIMEPYVQRAMPSLHERHWREIDAGAWGWPLVRRINAATSNSFSEWVDVRLIDRRTGQELQVKTGAGPGAVDTEWANIVRMWPRIYDESDLTEAFIRGEKLRGLHKTSFLWSRVIDGEVVTDALAPHTTRIDPDTLLPRRIDRARKITVPLSGPAYGEECDSGLYVKYERVAKPRPNEEAAAPMWRAAIVDTDGHVVDDARAFGEDTADPAWMRTTMSASGENLVGAHPVVGWYEEPPPGPYAAIDHALRKAQIGLNLWLIQLGEAFYLGANGVWSISGAKPTSFDAANNPIYPKRSINYRKILSLEEREELKLTQARTNLTPLIEAVERRIKQEAMARNLPAYVLDTNRQPSNISGAARHVERADLEMVRQAREKLLRRDASRALDSWQRNWNLIHPEGDPQHIPAVVGFKVLFRSMPSESFDQSAMQGIKIADDLGIAPRWDYPRMLEGLTVDEAMRRVRANEAFAGEPATPGAEAEMEERIDQPSLERVTADKQAVRSGFKSHPSVVKSYGGDPATVIREQAESMAAREAAGVKVDSDPKDMTNAGFAQFPRPPADEDGTLIPMEEGETLPSTQKD